MLLSAALEDEFIGMNGVQSEANGVTKIYSLDMDFDMKIGEKKLDCINRSRFYFVDYSES